MSKPSFIETVGLRPYASLFLVFALVAFCTGLLFDLSGILHRAELQTIDRMFEARRWIAWTAEGLNRLKPAALLEYHEKHEIPRRWWAWDYTLSWLIEPNHIPVKHKIVIFNHLLEDEPPLEALHDHPWMKALMQYPLSRAKLAETIEFLAKSGAKLIVLDNDFPQYTDEDMILARTIHKAENGELTGKPIPVLMAATVNHRSFANVLQLELNSGPEGILKCLEQLEPGVDVQSKYTGTTSMILDEDQVVRRVACILPSRSSDDKESLTLKSISAIHESLPEDLPKEMDIDFAGPPNSELYPVRPFSYLLDPEIKKRIANPPAGSTDVSLPGAIVIIGDGVSDLYPTPYTNLGVNLMSGPEILAQSIDTIARQSWRYRLNSAMSIAYTALCAMGGGLLLCAWKRFYSPRFHAAKYNIMKLGLDLACTLSIVAISYAVALYFFCYARIIVPVVVPAISLMFASLATAFWERENERSQALKQELAHAEERLILQHEKHEEELKRQVAEAQVLVVKQDEQRRKEFVRKINHDLKAPVTVMSWILSKLKQGGLNSESAPEKLERLAKTSDRLVDLLHELACSYEAGESADTTNSGVEPCQLNKILQDCIAMANPLAEMKESSIQLKIPERILWVNASPLQVARIFDNLIRNAIIHNPKRTTILVEARSRAHVHQISIADNGAGISQDKLEHIFDKEYAESFRTTEGEGMGLQIVKSFVEAMGGKISLKSEAGCGTTFTVSLPSGHIEPGGESQEAGEELYSSGRQFLPKESLVTASSIENRGPEHD